MQNSGMELAARRLAVLGLDADPAADWAALEDRLALILEDWLAHRLPELVQLAYRLDLPEAQFTAALAGRSLPEAARQLARAFIAREQQRAATRRHGFDPTATP